MSNKVTKKEVDSKIDLALVLAIIGFFTAGIPLGIISAYVYNKYERYYKGSTNKRIAIIVLDIIDIVGATFLLMLKLSGVDF